MIEDVLSGAEKWWVEHGNCIEVLRRMPDESVDAAVTDAPYGLGEIPDANEMLRCWVNNQEYTPGKRGFMCRDWDSFIPGPMYWREVLRVLKPGGYCLVFAGTRTFDLMTLALRMAGFEIRDSIASYSGSTPEFATLTWCYGSGMPKSYNISNYLDDPEEADKYRGLGGGLKPSQEPIVVARKQLDGTYIENIRKHGTGLYNIDACRVAHASAEDLANHSAGVTAIKERGGSMEGSWKNSSDLSGASDVNTAGRWPTNLVMTHSAGCEGVCRQTCPARAMDEQSGECKSGIAVLRNGGGGRIFGHGKGYSENDAGYTDDGSASRYFPQFHWDPALDDLRPFTYCAKASRAEKDRGLEDFPVIEAHEITDREEGSTGSVNPRSGKTASARNSHPTPKPVEVMRWLVRLVTPTGGTVLDPFCGSGTTGVAAYLEGFRFIGIELNNTAKEPFVSIARARIVHVAGGDPRIEDRPAELKAAAPVVKQLKMFG